jgi:hypothetical protein
MATVRVGLGANGANAEQVHVGCNVAVCKVSLSVSWSSGDVHVIGKLPNGAIPLDWVWYPGAASPAALIAKFGTSASQELFLASDSYAETQTLYRNIKRAGPDIQISLSDDARVLYENIVMVATAGISIGNVGSLVVFYKMPGQTL